MFRVLAARRKEGSGLRSARRRLWVSVARLKASWVARRDKEKF